MSDSGSVTIYTQQNRNAVKKAVPEKVHLEVMAQDGQDGVDVMCCVRPFQIPAAVTGRLGCQWTIKELLLLSLHLRAITGQPGNGIIICRV